MITRLAMTWGARLYTWGAVRFLLADSKAAGDRLDPPPVTDGARAAKLIGAELEVIPRTVRNNIAYRDAEVRIQTERLMRRYDLGGALNEAAQRAIQQKAAVPPGYPTEQQKAALKLQEETLKDRIRRS
ncbi:MAG TPA: hypothetical protein VKQ70_15700 [Caulobacteraceae bacterium]|nr:hypothetical protein [Caulobacteraceae bacterium]